MSAEIEIPTDTTQNLLRYEIQHKITGEVRYFNHARRALNFLNGPLNDDKNWIGVTDIRMVQVLDVIY